ncbi:MAG: NIL domain-containing protein [Fimbriimonadaceae bacterium]
MESVVINIAGSSQAFHTPWISRLSRDFALNVVILKANVDPDMGWVQIGVEGTVEDIQRATAWLMTTGMHIESLSRALGA